MSNDLLIPNFVTADTSLIPGNSVKIITCEYRIFLNVHSQIYILPILMRRQLFLSSLTYRSNYSLPTRVYIRHQDRIKAKLPDISEETLLTLKRERELISRINYTTNS